ncbi:MAG: DUF2335 domain-containing protein [Verrucomicrobiota bacterium]
MGKHNSPYLSKSPAPLPEQQAAIQEVQLSMVTRGGPLPDPEVLAGYEKVMAGAAERIFKMAEIEQHERHLAFYREQRTKSVAILLGQVLAFLMGISGILGGVYLVAKDKSLAGFSVFLTSLAALCGVYLHNRRDQQAEQQAGAKK